MPSDANASGRSFGREELELLQHVIESGTLTCTKGTDGAALREALRGAARRAVLPVHDSGTAAIHAAIAAIDPEPGDEIITTSITDMGALTPILYQGAIPVFADVDPHTYNVTADTIAARSRAARGR